MSAQDDLKKSQRSLKAAKGIAIRKVLSEFRVLIPELIKIRTRGQGQGVKSSLPKLSPVTIALREKYKSNLHPETSPGESNLTATGQLLEAIEGKIKSGGITFSINKKRRKKELFGNRSKVTNEEVRSFVERAGFNFFDIAEQDRKELIELAEKIIIDEIKKALGQ